MVRVNFMIILWKNFWNLYLQRFQINEREIFMRMLNKLWKNSGKILGWTEIILSKFLGF